jgi:pilus assembly protein CpaE
VTLGGVRFLVLLGDGVEESEIRAALPSAAPIWVSSLQQGAERADQLVEEVSADVVLVGCASHSESALSAIRALASGRSDRPIVVLYEGNPNGFMDPAFEAGADDLITLPQGPVQLAFALEKVIARRRGPSAASQLSPMISILGPKGGTGKTLTACNLAVSLAQVGAHPVVVDLDLQFGDVGLALGLKPARTIYDLAVAGEALDGGKVDSFVLDHPSGVRALLAPVRPDQAAAISVSFLRKLFEILRGRYDFVIVDTPPAFSPEVIAAIDSSSHLCMVGMLDALSLKDTKIGFETLRQMGYDPAETTLILNRADTSVGISQEDVRQVLGKSPDVLVPSDRAIPRAITSGSTIVEAEPRSGPARAFGQLAELYLQEASIAMQADSETATRAPRASFRRGLLRKGA